MTVKLVEKDFANARRLSLGVLDRVLKEPINLATEEALLLAKVIVELSGGTYPHPDYKRTRCDLCARGEFRVDANLQSHVNGPFHALHDDSGSTVTEVVVCSSWRGTVESLARVTGAIPNVMPTRDTDESPVFDGNMRHLNFLRMVLKQDEAALYENDVAYDASWKKRDGHSAFENLCRKWDRLYARVKKHGWELFEAARLDTRREGVIGDIRDLRRYLALAECELLRRGSVVPETETKDSVVGHAVVPELSA